MSGILHVPISYIGMFESLPEKTLGQRITKARMYHGLTKQEFADRIGARRENLRWMGERFAQTFTVVHSLDKLTFSGIAS